ncbi:MAG TPA: hypothetical protein VKR06_17510 [Ktedonosporobacter sp.]|nr:hypothetical protein [Ktedonosporobacter sp.]
MSSTQQFAAISAFIASILGLLSLLYAIFGPTYQGASSTGEQGTTSLFQIGIQPVTILFLCLLFLAFLGVSVCVILQRRAGSNSWRILLWLATLWIVALTVLSLPSIGLLILPGACFAIVACILSLFAGK